MASQIQVLVPQPSMVGTFYFLQPTTGVIGPHVVVADLSLDPPAISAFPSSYSRPIDDEATIAICGADTFLHTASQRRHVKRGAQALIRAIHPGGLLLDRPTKNFCLINFIDYPFLLSYWPYHRDLIPFIEEDAVEESWAKQLPRQAGLAMSVTLRALDSLEEDEAALRRVATTACYRSYVHPLVTPAEAFVPLLLARPSHPTFPWRALGAFRGLAGLFWRPCHFTEDDNTLLSSKIHPQSLAIPRSTIYRMANEEDSPSAQYVANYFYGMDFHFPSVSILPTTMEDSAPSLSCRLPHPEGPIALGSTFHQPEIGFISLVEAALGIDIFVYSIPTTDLLAVGVYSAAYHEQTTLLLTSTANNGTWRYCHLHHDQNEQPVQRRHHYDQRQRQRQRQASMMPMQ